MKTISGIEFASEHNGTDVFRLIELAYEQGQKDGHSEQLGTDLAKVGTDLISRAQAIDAVKRLSLGETDATRLAMRIGDYLERLPSAPPKMGKWIYHIDDLFPAESTMECNQCHAEQPLTCDDEFCPHCGAKMEVME